MLENLRIHFLGVGFNWDWFPKSLKHSRADKVYLFRIDGEKKRKALTAEKEMMKIMKKKGIDYEMIKYKQKDIFDLLRKIREIIESEKKNFIYLNISAGQRVVLTAFALSSMLFKSIPKELKLYSMEEGDFDKIPSFEAKLPEKKLIEAMRFLGEQRNECSKKKLKDHVFGVGILKTDKTSDSNKYMLLDRRIISKLLQWNLIEIHGKGKGALIELKEDGENLIKFL